MSKVTLGVTTTVPDQNFGLAISVENLDDMNGYLDGVFGMGYPGTIGEKMEPWIKNAYKQKLIGKEMFSFWFNPQDRGVNKGGELSLGGVNKNRFTG